MCFDLLIADQQARGQVITNRAKYKVRDAKNERAASESAVQKWGQSLSNKRIMDAAGSNFGTLAENFSRRVDARTLNTGMGQLRHGEDIGRLTASAASAGIGGSSVEQLNATLETANALQMELTERSARSEDYLAAQEAGRVIPDAIASMDNNLYMANLDYSDYGPTKGPSALGTLATIAVSAAAAALGAPDIGKAITSAKTSSLQANFGIGDGGVAAMQTATSSFKSGFGQVRSQLQHSKGSVGPATNSFTGGIDRLSSSSFSGLTQNMGSLGSVTFR